MEALSELTVAVGDVTHAVQALRSDVCAHYPRSGGPYSERWSAFDPTLDWLSPRSNVSARRPS